MPGQAPLQAVDDTTPAAAEPARRRWRSLAVGLLLMLLAAAVGATAYVTYFRKTADDKARARLTRAYDSLLAEIQGGIAFPSVGTMVAFLHRSDPDLRAVGGAGFERTSTPGVVVIDRGSTPSTLVAYVRSTDGAVFRLVGSAATRHASVSRTYPYSRLVFDDRPRAYWRFDETRSQVAFDSSPAGTARGIYVGRVRKGLPGAVHGEGGTAIDLSARGSYVQAPGAALPERNHARTVELWLRTRSRHAGVIFGYGTPQLGQAFGVALGGPSQLVVWSWANDKTFDLSAPLDDGRWHYVVATFDGLRKPTATVYVDGQSQGSQTWDAPLATQPSTYPPTIGMAMSGGNEYAGELDDLAVYDRVLSADDVARHYSGR